jgi:hypothetical protein
MRLSSMARKIIAQNILFQLGGSSLLTISIHAHSFTIGSNGSLTFRFKGFRGANRVRIYLNDKDLYTLEFSRVIERTEAIQVTRVYTDVPMDRIKEVFEEYIKRKISL